jgi:hypothetical protein
MYVNTNMSDDIDLRYTPISDDSDETLISFHTEGDYPLGDILDYAVPSCDVKQVDALSGGNYNVVLKFGCRKDMMEFLWFFAPKQMEVKEKYLETYREQKENAVLS